MFRMCREVSEREESEMGTANVTKFFRISKTTYDCLMEHGPYNAMMLFEESGQYFISVSAFEVVGKWDGWSAMWDDFNTAGIDPDEFDL